MIGDAQFLERPSRGKVLRDRDDLIASRHQRRRGICDSPCFLPLKQLRGWLGCLALKDPMLYGVSNGHRLTHTGYELERRLPIGSAAWALP